jgi:SpoVK/Ycf46/Vps4 family AAA+-type ATPase
MSESQSTNDKIIIHPFQKRVYDRLCAIARAVLNVKQPAIGFKLRTCFLLIGPSGCGKTFLARALSQEMQVPFLTVSVSDWILLGASNRGGTSTWPAVFDFIERSKHKEGAIIFIDELDKCSHDSNWNAFLRSEIFSLCDSRVPVAINDLDGEKIPEHRINAVKDFLQSKTMILAGAAFQHIWDTRSRPSMGFVRSPVADDPPELPDLAKTLPRELVNRFSSEILILPELTGDDYRQMLESAAVQVADTWRERFLNIGISKIRQAVSHKKGARFIEEVLLAAIIEERAYLTSAIPSEASSNNTSKHNGKDPDLLEF